MKLIVFYLIGLCIILLFGRIIFKSWKKILKLVLNSVLGAFLLAVFNLVSGSLFNFQIPLNVLTAIITGALGIPGIIILAIFKILI